MQKESDTIMISILKVHKEILISRFGRLQEVKLIEEKSIEDRSLLFLFLNPIYLIQRSWDLLKTKSLINRIEKEILYIDSALSHLE